MEWSPRPEGHYPHASQTGGRRSAGADAAGVPQIALRGEASWEREGVLTNEGVRADRVEHRGSAAADGREHTVGTGRDKMEDHQDSAFPASRANQLREEGRDHGGSGVYHKERSGSGPKRRQQNAQGSVQYGACYAGKGEPDVPAKAVPDDDERYPGHIRADGGAEL